MALSDLHRYIQSVDKTEFDWGTHDCCMFAANCVSAFTGNHPNKKLRYDTEQEAREILQDHGGMVGLWDTYVGNRIAVESAKIGDVVVIESAKGDAAGICLGSVSVFCSSVGVRCRPTKEAKAAWGVQCQPYRV